MNCVVDVDVGGRVCYRELSRLDNRRRGEEVLEPCRIKVVVEVGVGRCSVVVYIRMLVAEVEKMRRSQEVFEDVDADEEQKQETKGSGWRRYIHGGLGEAM